MIECKLMDSGLLLTSDGDSLVLKDFLNGIMSGRETIKETAHGNIKLSRGYYDFYIKFTEEQKFKYENNISDPNLDLIRKMFEIQERNQLEKDIISKAKRGELPDKKEYISIYSKYLNKEILSEIPSLLAESVKSLWPELLVLVSIPIWRYVDLFGELRSWLQVVGLFAAVGANIGSLAGFLIGIMNDWERYIDLRIDIVGFIDKLKIYLLKNKDLKKHVKELERPASSLLEGDFNSFVAYEQGKDREETIKLSDEGLERINRVIDKLDELSEEKKKEYITKLQDIFLYYRKKVEQINGHKNEGLVFGQSTEMIGLLYTIEQSLVVLEVELDDIINNAKIEQANQEKFDKECDAIAQKLQIPAYKDGWTDEIEEPNFTEIGLGGGAAMKKA